MITNCPNCGSVLNSTGKCYYCGTTVVPSLDVFRSNAFGYRSITELNINVIDSYGKAFTIPLIGNIESVKVSMNSPYEENEIEFNFVGRIRNE